MSLRAMLWALYEAPVENTAERIILIVMADAADEKGQRSHLAIETIAQRTFLGESTVRRHRSAMRERGLITVSDDMPPSLMALPADKRPTCYDLSLRAGAQIERALDAGPKPKPLLTTTTEGSSTQVAAAATGVQEETLDSPQQPSEDGETAPVTARNSDLQWTAQHLLRSWFHVERVEQVEAWRQAWKTGVDVAGEGYDPQTHLIAYLTRCHEQDRKPSPSLWLRFLIEDRLKWLAEQAAQRDRLEQQASADGGEQWALGTLSRTPKWGDRT